MPGRGEQAPHRDLQRTWTILATARGIPTPGSPRRWAPVFSNVQVAGIKAMVCTPPSDRRLPLTRFSSGEIVNLTVSVGLVESISPVTLSHWMAADVIKPWQH